VVQQSWVQSPRHYEDIALQQFEFYTQLIACQVLFNKAAECFDVSHKSFQIIGLPRQHGYLPLSPYGKNTFNQ
jgi:hypothetical protein